MKYRPYAPKAPMTLLSGTPDTIASYINAKAAANRKKIFGALLTPLIRLSQPNIASLPLGDPADPASIALNLFANLRKFDELGVHEIYTEALPPDGIGAAIMDRLCKAAEGRFLDVSDRIRTEEPKG
jgi:L-threonylcarbamoyladenylate synthase